MGLFDQFPYTNFHELNLDWLLRLIKELESTVNNFVNLNTIKYANPIQWNITTQYEANTVVIDPNDGTAYLSVQPVPTGVAITNTDYWTPIFTLNLLSANQNITLRDDGSNTLATFASVAGDWLLWNSYLYKVSQNINTNEAYVVGYNLDRYTIEQFIRDYVTKIENSIGDLTSLTTSDTSSIVASINELVGIINTLTSNIEILEAGYVSTANFSSVQDAVEFAHNHNINTVVFGRDEVILKPILLYDNMILDGRGHRLSCDPTFVGNRAITNINSGYWNYDNSTYLPFYDTLGVNYNITVKNLILGDFYRTNNDAHGNNIGGNCKPRNWLAFDSIKNLTIDNIKSDSYTTVESYIWNTQAENVNISNCDLTTTGYGGTGGIFWQYTRFDSGSETVRSNFSITVDNCIFNSSTDEAIAIRAYNVGTITNAIVKNCKFTATSGQAITIDADQGNPNNVLIEDCYFYNCAARSTNRIIDIKLSRCVFKSDNDNVSNQGYAFRSIASSGININNEISSINIDSCYFDEYVNYTGPIWVDLVKNLKVNNCTFKAQTQANIAVNYGDIANVNISNNTIINFNIAIQPYIGGTDINWNHQIVNNNAMDCNIFIDVTNRMRYTSVCNNTMSNCGIGIKYHGSQFKGNSICDNYMEAATKFIEMATGTASSGVSKIDGNVVIDDSFSDSKFFDNQISFVAMHFINNYWSTFNANVYHTYPNT